MTVIFMRGRDRVEIGTSTVPRRKHKALVSITGARETVLGYFRSEDDSRRFEELLTQVWQICNAPAPGTQDGGRAEG